MYSGYVLFCEKTTLGQCVSKRQYSCSDSHKEEVETIKRGSVLFMYDPQTKTLIGPFTAASEGASRIETGTWRSEIDRHTPSADIKLEWQDLHIISNADEKFSFIADPEKCELSTLNVQTLLDALKEAPVYQGQ
jgi:hypothetical protein